MIRKRRKPTVYAFIDSQNLNMGTQKFGWTQDLSKPVKDNKETDNQEEKKPIKGNIDVELVLWAMKEIEEYDKAIIVSGDGDFYSLTEYLQQRGKLLHILTPNRQYSQLLNHFDKYVVRLDSMRDFLAFKPHGKVTDKK
jgi:uncharacterized LabA/DUF88 family protein